MQIRVTLTDEEYKKLKVLANHDYRSVPNYASYIIKNFINDPEHILFTPHVNNSTSPYPSPTFTDAPTPAPSPTPALTPASYPEILRSRIEEHEQNLKIKNNEFFNQVKKFYTVDDPDLDCFVKLLNAADNNDINAFKDEQSAIFAALDIPMTHTLTDTQWSEIISYFQTK